MSSAGIPSLQNPFQQFLNGKTFFWMLFALAVSTALPMIWLGSDAFFYIHDNYDDLAATKATLIHGDGFSLSGSMDYIMNGLPRGTARSPFNLTFLLFAVFGGPAGYIINYLLGHAVAFIGMYLLLKNHLIKEQRWLAVVVALLFSQVSWYSIYGWFVAGQPLIYYCFLNLWKNKATKSDWIIIAAFPFTCTMILTAPFVMTALALGLVYFWRREGQLPRKYLQGMALMLASFVISDLGMFYETFAAKSFVSHRSLWPLPEMIGIKAGFRNAVGEMFFTHFHGGMFLTRMILGGLLIYFSIALGEWKIRKRFLVLPVLIFLVCLFHAFYPVFVNTIGSKLSLLRMVQLDRFYFLLPCLWLVLFALLLKEIFRIPQLRLLGALLIFGQFYAIVNENQEFTENVKKIRGGGTEMSFRQFFAEEQFSALRAYIQDDPGNYRVASLGLPAAIPLYNGFYVLDGYLNNYSLDYKLKFRKVMEKELDRDPEFKKYFDEWGNRCYLFSADLHGNFWSRKEQNNKISSLELDLNAFKALGGKYLISAAEVLEPGTKGLSFEKQFSHPASAWEIYLYKVQ